MQTTAPAPPLRDYQDQMVVSVRRAIDAHHPRMYCALPTGCGKTRVASELVFSAASGGRRVLWLVHRKELVHQAANAIMSRLSDTDKTVGIVMAADDDSGADIVVASVQSLRPARLAQVTEAGPITRVIVDECHHVSPGSMYHKIIDALEAETPGLVVVGITATPYRADRKDMQEILPYCAFDRDIPTMIDTGWLCGLRYKQIPIESLDLTEAKMSRTLGERDFAQKDLAPACEREDVVMDTVVRTIDHIGDRPTIVFAASVHHAQQLARWYGNAVKSAAIWGDMPATDRADILQRWRDGDIQLVTNCAVLTEGFDFPGIQCVVIARPTLSVGLYTQMVGRGTRITEGKDDCLILDITGRMPARAVAIDLGELVGEDIDETEPEIDGTVVVRKKQTEHHLRPHKLRDPYGQARFAWTEHPEFEHVWFAPVGPKYVALIVPDPVTGLFQPYVAEEMGWAQYRLLKAGPEPTPRRQAIADLEATLAKSGRRMDRANAQWRGGEATVKQFVMLQRLNPRLWDRARSESWSRGDVSLAIAACMLRPCISAHLPKGA